MKLATALCLLLVAASPPPMPKLHKRPAAADLTTKGAGAKALLTRPLTVVITPARTNALLTWAWVASTNNPASNVVFIIRRCKTNQFVRPSTNWPTVAVVQTNGWKEPIDRAAKCCWFTVTASNTQTHLESPFATR